METEHKILHHTDKNIGLDLGIKDLLITSNGQKFDNQKLTEKYEDKLAKEQRKLSHKVKGSKNWDKFILFSLKSTTILLFVKFVIYDFLLFFLLLNFG